WLYQTSKILHRDISLGNLMFRHEKDDIFGVLNGFDLACYVNETENHPASKQRTGTRPFMSIDLINPTSPVKHLYRHDLESFFHVFMFFTARYQDGKEIDSPPLQKWLTLGDRALEAHKVNFLSKSVPTLTPQFASLKWHLYSMCIAIFNGLTERTKKVHIEQRKFRICSYHEPDKVLAPDLPVPSFDHETLNGHLTYEVFDDIFRRDVQG
ncbi:hypothetical protein BU17DRAFT_58828, partial [Hysterangium stoloniferum]